MEFEALYPWGTVYINVRIRYPYDGRTLSVAAPPVRVPAALEGIWETSGQGPDAPDGTPGMSWSIELELKGDVYRRVGYPEWEERARISRVQRDGRTFRLTLVEHTRNGRHRYGRSNYPRTVREWAYRRIQRKVAASDLPAEWGRIGRRWPSVRGWNGLAPSPPATERSPPSPLAKSRLLEDGDREYRIFLKTPWSDGTSSIQVGLLELMVTERSGVGEFRTKRERSQRNAWNRMAACGDYPTTKNPSGFASWGI